MSKEVLLKVCKIVSAEFGIFPKEMREKSRLQNVVFARMVLTNICREFKIKQNEIAEFLNQSQPNVNIYIRKFETELKFNAEFRKKYEVVTKKVNKK